MLKELQVKIGATTVEFQRKMQDVQATVARVGSSFTRFSQQASQSFSNVAKSLEKNADSIRDFGETTSTYFTLPLGVAAGASIKMASDFQESLNKVNVAFGTSAGDVVEWSKTSIDSMGMASGSALDSAALFGDMATSMGIGQAQASNMSKSLVQLGADMASFKNVPIEQAMQALNGVFTGETESLKMLGVVMTQTQLEAFALSQGIQKNVKDMTEAEMVNLRYAFVMSKTTNAQGDFARTSDGSANQMRIFWESLKEVGKQIGDVVLPAFTSFLQFANKILKSFMGLSDGAKFLIAGLTGLAIAIPPLLIGLGMLGQALPYITGGFDKMGKGMKGALGWIGLIVTAITTLVAYLSTSNSAFSNLEQTFDKFMNSMESFVVFISAKFKTMINDFIISIYELEIKVKNFAKNTSDFFGLSFDSFGESVNDLQNKINKLNTENLNIAMGYFRSTMNLLNEDIQNQIGYIADLMGTYNYWTKSIADMAGSKGREAIEIQEQKNAKSLEDTNKKLEEQKKKLEEQKKKLQELAKVNLDFAKTLNEAVIKALENKNASIIESVKVTEDAIEAEKEALEDLSKTYEDQYEDIRQTIDDNYKTQLDQIKDRYEQEVDNEKDLTQTKIDEVEKRRKNLENQIANEIALAKDQAYEQKKQAILNEMFQYKNLKTREEVLNAISKLTIEREKDLNSDGNSLKLEAIEQFSDEENKLIRDRLSEYRRQEYSNLTDRIEALKKEGQANLDTKEKMYQNDLAMLNYFRDQEHEANKANLTRNLAIARQESNEKIAYFKAEIKEKEKGLTDLSTEEKKQMEAKRLLLQSDHKDTKELLNEFNKDYYIAGRDFASELLKGLESKKSDITKLMSELATPYKPSEPVKSVLEQGKELGQKVTGMISNVVASVTPKMVNPILFANVPTSTYGVDTYGKTYSDLKKDTASTYTTPRIFLDSREITKAVAPNMVDTVRAKTGFY